MKNTLFTFILLFAFAGCSKEEKAPDTTGISINKNIFITISFKGKTITSYGITSTIPLFDHTDYMYIDIYTGTTNGRVTTDAWLEASTDYTQYFSNLSKGQVEISMSLEKDGDAVGDYKFYNLDPNYIADLTQGYKEYDIDERTAKLRIVSIQNGIAKGTFSFNLIEGSNLVPATGTFALWAN